VKDEIRRPVEPSSPWPGAPSGVQNLDQVSLRIAQELDPRARLGRPWLAERLDGRGEVLVERVDVVEGRARWVAPD